MFSTLFFRLICAQSVIFLMGMKCNITDYFSCLADYAKGFGGKYGIQKDRQDESAAGWDHHEKVEKHASQKGIFSLFESMGL